MGRIMTHKEAQEIALKVRWKVEFCHQGESCWCRIITPEEPLYFDEDEEYYIVHSGAIDTLTAEHIVNIHNNSLK